MWPEDEAPAPAINLSVPTGEFLALLGSNRSGKSLILELCAGLVTPRRGIVRVLGHSWATVSDEERIELRRHIGTVLQQPGLLSNMTLYNNVAVPLRYHRVDLEEDQIDLLVLAQLTALRLTHLRERFPGQLSAGEARCAAIARAMVLNPTLLLLDDPVAGLDTVMVEQLGRHVVAARARLPMTIVATFRSVSPLLDHADRVAFVSGGRIEAIGPRSALLDPAGLVKKE
ncbi:MAG: ATP-binding cassette domain-containing protein [Nitrospiraceae bacterium]